MQGQVDVNNEKRTTIKMMKIVILTLVNYLPLRVTLMIIFLSQSFIFFWRCSMGWRWCRRYIHTVSLISWLNNICCRWVYRVVHRFDGCASIMQDDEINQWYYYCNFKMIVLCIYKFSQLIKSTIKELWIIFEMTLRTTYWSLWRRKLSHFY